MNKLVVYTQRVEVIESYNERRDCIDQRIAEFLKVCGYTSIALPNNADIAIEIVNTINPTGIVLTGGNSLLKYGGNAPERDETDRELIRIAIEKHIPIYGFCRGMQSILDYFGERLENVGGHVAKRHVIQGNISGEVNSYHNQACIELRDDSVLGIDAICKDGVIEAIYHKDLPIIANMWHPERENVFCNVDVQRIQNLFK